MVSLRGTVQRDLFCPECGSRKTVYSGTSLIDGAGYEATDGRYSITDWGYNGALIVDVRESDPKENFRGCLTIAKIANFKF